MELSTLFILLTIGVLAGIASGFVGIGGGLIIVPALIYFLGFRPTHCARHLTGPHAAPYWHNGSNAVPQ